VSKDGSGTVKRTQTRAYDELSRLLRTIGAATQTTNFGYDNNSNLTSLTDPRNKSTGFGFDALNRLITATNPLMGVRSTGYDPQNNVTSESDERNIATSYVYNGFGEVIQEASPDGGAIVHVRDSAGNVTQKTDARGQVVQYSYDALNRVTAATFSGAPTFNITYSYDSAAAGNYGIGRLTPVTDTSGQTAIRYDHRGNVTGAWRPSAIPAADFAPNLGLEPVGPIPDFRHIPRISSGTCPQALRRAYMIQQGGLPAPSFASGDFRP
jgi:YD repeat-containing protein